MEDLTLAHEKAKRGMTTSFLAIIGSYILFFAILTVSAQIFQTPIPSAMTGISMIFLGGSIVGIIFFLIFTYRTGQYTVKYNTLWFIVWFLLGLLPYIIWVSIRKPIHLREAKDSQK
jgi:hypothetical protein